MTEKTYKVYKRIAPDGRVYVGCTSQTLEKRAGFMGFGYRANLPLWSAIQDYGWSNFKTELVLETTDVELAARTELETISLCQSDNPEFGFNKRSQTYITDTEFPERLSSAIKSGMTDDVKARMSKSMKEYYQNDQNREFHRERVHRVIDKPEVRLKLTRANRLNLAKPEVKAKLRASLKRYWTPERRAAQIELSKERLATPEVRARISENTAAALSNPEVRAKMSEAQKTKWADPEYHARTQAAMKAACNTEEHRKNVSEAQKIAQNRPEVKAKLSSTFSGLIFVNNGIISRRVRSDEAEKMIATGEWVRGRMSHGPRGSVQKLQNRVWINLNGVSKFVDQSEVAVYSAEGWSLGRGRLK